MTRARSGPVPHAPPCRYVETTAPGCLCFGRPRPDRLFSASGRPGAKGRSRRAGRVRPVRAAGPCVSPPEVWLVSGFSVGLETSPRVLGCRTCGRVGSARGPKCRACGRVESIRGRAESICGRVRGICGRVRSARGPKCGTCGRVESICGRVSRTCGPKFSIFGRLVFGFVSIFGGSGVERSRSCVRTRGDCAANVLGVRRDRRGTCGGRRRGLGLGAGDAHNHSPGRPIARSHDLVAGLVSALCPSVARRRSADRVHQPFGPLEMSMRADISEDRAVRLDLERVMPEDGDRVLPVADCHQPDGDATREVGCPDRVRRRAATRVGGDIRNRPPRAVCSSPSLEHR